MSNVKKTVLDFEGRNIDVLFVHRCRAKTLKGVARLLNLKYVQPIPGLDDSDFFSEDDVADMFRLGLLEQHDGYIYVLCRM